MQHCLLQTLHLELERGERDYEQEGNYFCRIVASIAGSSQSRYRRSPSKRMEAPICLQIERIW
jgi:hypothetical protein